MTKPRLLITRRVFDEVIEALAARFEIESNQTDDEWTAEQTVVRAADKDALFVVASDYVDGALIDAAPRLRIIATGSVGFNHIDLAACARRGIVVSITPDVLTEATADMAWTLLMATARRVTEAERWLRDGHWTRWAWDQFLGADINGATLGIIGMGRIGSAIARRARGFEMRILYSNRSVAPNEAELGATRVDRDRLLAEAGSGDPTFSQCGGQRAARGYRWRCSQRATCWHSSMARRSRRRSQSRGRSQPLAQQSRCRGAE